MCVELFTTGKKCRLFSVYLFPVLCLHLAKLPVEHGALLGQGVGAPLVVHLQLKQQKNKNIIFKYFSIVDIVSYLGFIIYKNINIERYIRVVYTL